MRVLRLGNSEDRSPGIADSDRAWYIAGIVLAEACGESVETVVRPISPTRELPDLLDKWLDEYQPDLVLLKVTWYWYSYESVPRRIERLLGRSGKPIARAGTRAGESPRFATKRWFKLCRRAAHRIIGGDTPFPSSQVLEVMEECIRRVKARENVALLVKGTGGNRYDEETLAGYYQRFVNRREHVEGTIEKFCRDADVPYVNTKKAGVTSRAELAASDGLHTDLAGQERMGLKEGEQMVSAWRAFNRRALPVEAAGGR